MDNIIIRPIKVDEIHKVAALISDGYYDDIFFKWVVEHDEVRREIVTDYYKIYIRAGGSLVHVAESPSGELLGATVWLPHDVDAGIYEEMDTVTGAYKDNFRAVADMSHNSEPPMTPFYQLVAVVVDKKMQGLGLGAQLLKHNLDKFDAAGIPTYLEASTPYFGGGVYGKFGYQPVGELMVFAPGAVLYPLWRDVPKKPRDVTFAGRDWRVLTECEDRMLLLSEHVLELRAYHESYECVTWAGSDIRRYLNGEFYNSFSESERAQVIEGEDYVFVLSLEEVMRYLGEGGELVGRTDMFYVDDAFNDKRKATLENGAAARWYLRTAGRSKDFVCVVTVDGRMCVTGDFVNRKSTPLFNVGVRPAMWVRKG